MLCQFYSDLNDKTVFSSFKIGCRHIFHAKRKYFLREVGFEDNFLKKKALMEKNCHIFSSEFGSTNYPLHDAKRTKLFEFEFQLVKKCFQRQKKISPISWHACQDMNIREFCRMWVRVNGLVVAESNKVGKITENENSHFVAESIIS